MAAIEVKKEMPEEGMALTSEPSYPYGTSISLHDELLESLNLGEVTVGQEFMLRGIVAVTAVSSYDDGEGTERCVSLQFKMMDLTPDSAKDRVDRMYGDK